MFHQGSSHVLNLVISSASELRVISNALSTIVEVCSFLSRSAHRVQTLQGNIENEILNQRKPTIIGAEVFCPTRCVERHGSTIIFQRLFPAIVKTLEELHDKIPQVSAKATIMLNSIEKSRFVFACCVIEKFVGLILLLSKTFQKTTRHIFNQ